MCCYLSLTRRATFSLLFSALISLVGLNLLSACGTAKPAEAPDTSLMGTFQLTTEVDGFVFDSRLRCVTMQHCELSFNSTVPNGGGMLNDSDAVKPKPFSTLADARYALQYAVMRRDRLVVHVQQAEIRAQLYPTLAWQPELHRCWDLGQVEAGYTLACTMNQDPRARDTIYLFQTLKMPCGDAFCRYLISPLTRVR